MINRVSTSECCICECCLDVCPQQAIELKHTVEGFKYPVINEEKCVKCGLCDRVCPVQHIPEKKDILGSYAAHLLDENKILNSTSGGIFQGLAEYMLKDAGVVFGASLDKNFLVSHIQIDKIKDLKLILGSKYVQSSMRGCYKQIAYEISNGKNILFCGCPCQCAAVDAFLRNNPNRDKAILVDFICHGILSDELFHSYIDHLQKKHHDKVAKFVFRSKDKTGWASSKVHIEFEHGKIIEAPYYADPYVKGMISNICNKPSCYNCQFKNGCSGSDITLGDYWAAVTDDQEAYFEKGVSMVIINSEKGKSFFQNIEKNIWKVNRSICDLTRGNEGYYKPFSKSKKNTQYVAAINNGENPFEALEKVAKDSVLSKIKQKFLRILKR